MKLSKQQASLDVRKFYFSQHVVKQRSVTCHPREVVHATSVNQFNIGRFNQRQGEALPLKYFFAFEVCGMGKTTELSKLLPPDVRL